MPKKNDEKTIKKNVNQKHIEFYDKTLEILKFILDEFSRELTRADIEFLEMPKNSISTLDFLISAIGKVQKGQRLALGLDDDVKINEEPEINIIEGLKKEKIQRSLTTGVMIRVLIPLNKEFYLFYPECKNLYESVQEKICDPNSFDFICRNTYFYLFIDENRLIGAIYYFVDKDGNFCPNETRKIKFKVKGKGTFRAAANGNPASLESFQEPQMKLFSGQLTAIVQTTKEAGSITFEASAPGVKSAKIELISK